MDNRCTPITRTNVRKNGADLLLEFSSISRITSSSIKSTTSPLRCENILADSDDRCWFRKSVNADSILPQRSFTAIHYNFQSVHQQLFVARHCISCFDRSNFFKKAATTRPELMKPQRSSSWSKPFGQNYSFTKLICSVLTGIPLNQLEKATDNLRRD